MTTVAGIHLGPDTHANRPAATALTAGALYSCTDHSKVYISDGTTWTDWADFGGAAGGAAKTLLTTMTFAAVASVTSSTFPTTYNDLLVEWELWSSYGSGASSLRVQVGNTAVTTTAGDYAWQSNGGGAPSGSTSDTAWTWARAGIGQTNNHSVGAHTIRNYAAAAERYYLGNHGFASGASQVGGVDSGTYTPAASAINIIKIASDIANLTGEARIYGITAA